MPPPTDPDKKPQGDHIPLSPEDEATLDGVNASVWQAIASQVEGKAEGEIDWSQVTAGDDLAKGHDPADPDADDDQDDEDENEDDEDPEAAQVTKGYPFYLSDLFPRPKA